MAKEEKHINSLLVPLGHRVLLLPQTAMAEIVRKPDFIGAGDEPDWLIGSLPWRGITIPLIELELLCGDINPANKMTQAIVVHTIKNGQFNFYALVTAEIPRPVYVGQSALHWADEADDCLVASASVVFQNEELIIPDLVQIEGRVAAILPLLAA